MGVHPLIEEIFVAQGLVPSAVSPSDSMAREQTPTLCADSANIQTLLDHADVLLKASRAVHGKAITDYATGELNDFERGLTDLISELESAHDRIERHLDKREEPLAAE